MMGFRFAATHPTALLDAGASRVAFPRWSVGTIKTAQHIPHSGSCVGWVEAEAETHRFSPPPVLSSDGFYQSVRYVFWRSRETMMGFRYAPTHPTGLVPRVSVGIHTATLRVVRRRASG